ncbi:hypothetical protein EKO27_g7125 [Xylaria grammica]|uniref:Uncharacterized protein n=1 Tax=Xylaria grammica TaxID=363999 RepID=A0A439D0K4_9PEZI|nr:hypothetical protein EKO27_g7125 [Xylaria grammica]
MFKHASVAPTPNREHHETPIADSGQPVVNNPSNVGLDAGYSGSQLQNHYDIPHHSKPQSSTTNLSPGPGFGVSWDQAEKAVDDFTSIFTAHFPFVILDHDITARRLFVEKPLLFRAILMIAVDFTCAKSREIRRTIDAWIGQHLLVMEEQNLGALQGLIVYIAWANPHFYSDNRATQLMYFTVGLAHSLGITREAISDNTQFKKESETNEEHRAFLACYYFLAFNSFQFGRPNPLSTSYVQHCIDSLERSSEFPTDFLLIKLVKFRQFIGRVPTVYQGLCDMKWYREISADTSDQLNEIRKDLDDSMSDVSHKHPKFSELFANMAKSFSPDGFLYAPFTALADIISMLIALSRLLLVEVDGWDLKKVRQNIDLKGIISEVKGKFSVANKIKVERVAAAAVANPSSYKPDGPDEERHDRLQTILKVIESIGSWLDDHGAFPSDNDELGEKKNDATNEGQTSPRVYTSPQSPQWNFTYFFESILQIRQSLTT